MKQQRQLYERQRLNRVIDYIYLHLDEPLDLNRLAEVACLSPYHWHRVYRGLAGESLATTVRRLRLHRAAGELLYSERNIADIAKRCGYPQVPSFSRAFAEEYGEPPGRFRETGHDRYSMSPADPLTHFSSVTSSDPHSGAETMHDVSIETLEPVELIGVSHAGDYMNIGQSFDKLYGWLGQNQLFGPGLRGIGVYLDDPEVVPAEKLRSMAAVTSPDMASWPENTLERMTLSGGDYAVLMHKGPYAELHQAYLWFYSQWLPQSGRQPADAPPFEEYLNNPCEVAPAELLTRICIPLVAV